MTRIAINGLGRIGRAAFKQLADHPSMQVVAVNDLVPADNLAYLLTHDTVYGQWHRPVAGTQDSLEVDGTTIPAFRKTDPAQLPWGDLDVDLVLECTGVFTDRTGLEKHLAAGADRVLLSAPAKSDDVPTVVPGVNQQIDEPVVSTASCTTNCIAPVVEVLGRRFGVAKATMTTLHAYTASQELVDGPASKWRRGRAAAQNLVPTTTGAAQATAKVLPEVTGRFDGAAVRAPVAAGSIADIVAVLEGGTSAGDVNDALRAETSTDRYQGIVAVADTPLVSSDIIGEPFAAIVDASMTQVIDDDLVKVMAWYDNEWGYVAQMLRQAERMADAANGSFDPDRAPRYTPQARADVPESEPGPAYTPQGRTQR